jgi:hypothetical protein
VGNPKNTTKKGGDENMRYVTIVEWTAENVPKIVETRSKNPIPQEITLLAEGVLFGQHKSILIVDSPDEKTLFKWMAPFVQIANFKTMPATSYEEAVKIVTGK